MGYGWNDPDGARLGDHFASITGPLLFGFGNHKIEPRTEADVVVLQKGTTSGISKCLATECRARADAFVTHEIVINEIMADPFGDDTYQEWIELYNPGNAPINGARFFQYSTEISSSNSMSRLAASWDVDSTIVDTPRASPPSSSDSAEPSTASPVARSTTTARPEKVRKPFPVNLRVLAFLAVLAVLGGIAFAVIKAAPDVTDPNSTVVVVATESATTGVGGSTTLASDGQTPDRTEELSVAPTIAGLPIASPAETTTSFDGFTETTVAPPTTEIKKTNR